MSSYPLCTPPSTTAVPVWQDRTIASSKLRMLEYSAFMEVQRDPDTVSLTTAEYITIDANASVLGFYVVSMLFSMVLAC